MNGLIRAMFAAMPLGEVVRLDLSFDERVFWDAWAASLIATLMCGLGPAWRATRIDVVRTIKGGGTQGDLLKMQRVVLVGQVAMSLALLCCASMFLRAWSQLRAADPGFAVKQRLFAEVFVSEPEFTPESAQEFYHTAVDRLRALPGVEGAAQAYILPPFGRQANCVGVRGGAPVRVPVGRVGDGFLAVLNVAVRNGREFTRAERGSAAGIVVNETLARRLWPGGGAVGQEALVGCETPLPMAVVGVARDIKPGEAHLFEPLGRTASGLMNLVIASAAPAQEAAARVRRALERPGVRVYAVKPLADHVERTFWQVRWEAAMLGVFGGLALLLAAVGLYGAMAYYVTQRTRELGIRMALGAGTRGVLWCVCLRGLRLTVIGVAIGIVISVAAGRVLARFLFGVNPIGWDSLLGSAALWIAVAGAACLVPALRAARIPAVLALRQE